MEHLLWSCAKAGKESKYPDCQALDPDTTPCCLFIKHPLLHLKKSLTERLSCSLASSILASETPVLNLRREGEAKTHE